MMIKITITVYKQYDKKYYIETYGMDILIENTRRKPDVSGIEGIPNFKFFCIFLSL